MIRGLRAVIGAMLIGAISLSFLPGDVSKELVADLNDPSVPEVHNISQDLNARNVLAIFAHPDDEQFAISLLFRAAQSGANVTLVTATRGESGKISHSAKGEIQPENLGDERVREVIEAGELIGVSKLEIWDYPDDRLNKVSRAKLNESVRNALCRHQPDLLVTFDPDSGYTGHADHRRIGLTAVQMASNLRAEPCANGYQGPASIATPITPTKGYTQHASARGKLAASRQPDPNLSMHASTSLRVAGWQLHRSQSNPLVYSFGLDEQTLYSRWTEELYRVFVPSETEEARKAPTR